MHHRPRTARTAFAALLAAVFIFASVAPASALINPVVTLDQESGGVPTRFTFVTVSDKDAAISAMDFTFPKGFDLSKIDFDAVTLRGLKATPVAIKGTASGETLSVTLVPSIAPSSTLRVQVRGVVPVEQGATYGLKIAYTAESTATGVPVATQHVDDTVKFTYRTPTLSELTSRLLDNNALAIRWNSEIRASRKMAITISTATIRPARMVPNSAEPWPFSLLRKKGKDTNLNSFLNMVSSKCRTRT